MAPLLKKPAPGATGTPGGPSTPGTPGAAGTSGAPSPAGASNPLGSGGSTGTANAANAAGSARASGAPKGTFITLEGIDGCGKSTQARLLADALARAGYDVLPLREPGGVAISEKIRALLLDSANAAMSNTCELLLYEAARAQLVHEVVAPALAAGKIVVCDRFYDSTTAYQGHGDGLDLSIVAQANALAVDGWHPALTLVYDIEPAAAAARCGGRAADRIEAKGLAYQERVARGFRAIAAREPARVRLIPATGDVAHVFLRTVRAVEKLGLAVPREAAEGAFLAASSSTASQLP